ncbi:MAG: arsenosugar biosynthesis radical SAM protein ArsS [Elusimicrobiota bacterium]|nr:arsenosugar biosynthesis radical SAM protein ArsS [Elusimicrobiota bacterium]
MSRPPARQLERLASLALPGAAHGGVFAAAVGAPLRPAALEVFQINLGKLCNMTCRHCHVDAGPDKTVENMDERTVDACLAALDKTQARVVDLTGGAPELNPGFRRLVDACVARGKRVIDRCNLTVLLLEREKDLAGFLAERGVEVTASLPHARRRSTDAQRGDGTFDKSLRALRLLNERGYGRGDPGRVLTLVSNPVGAFLPGDQKAMEKEWRAALAEEGVSFDRLLCIANMPISRYLDWLEASGNLEAYLKTLIDAYNPGTVAGLMCRNTLSVGWDGKLYDCDFNQMLELPLAVPGMTVFDFDPEKWAARGVVTARHCYGCTAGSGSSCGGQLA